jgi:hypothetical protein
MQESTMFDRIATLLFRCSSDGGIEHDMVILILCGCQEYGVAALSLYSSRGRTQNSF